MEKDDKDDFQHKMENFRLNVEALKPDTSQWLRIENYFFDPKEIYAIELTSFNAANGHGKVSIYLRSGLEIKTDLFAAKKIWEAFTGEKLVKE